MHKLKELVMEQNKYESGLLIRFEKEIKTLPEGSLCLKKISGKEYIYFQKTIKIPNNSCDKKNIIGDSVEKKTNSATSRKLLSLKAKEDQELINKIRRKFFLKKSIEHLHGNVKILEELLGKFHPFDPGQILQLVETECVLNQRL